jgi:glycosyltransferase involved in cell wall biosynthesis
MIPIYNSREDYLRETLESVLAQDPGIADMQIEVLDNCSTIGDPEALVRKLGGGRIAFHRQTHNLGIVGNFNACLERARGQWIQILHGDDTVRPDFYWSARAAVTAHPEVGAALCRTIYMDEDGQWMGVAELESRVPAVLDGDFAWRQLIDQRIQFVSIVVRRSTYEQLGGFRSSGRRACAVGLFQDLEESKPDQCRRRRALSANGRSGFALASSRGEPDRRL